MSLLLRRVPQNNNLSFASTAYVGTTRVLDDFSTGAGQALSARTGWGAGHWSGTLDLKTDYVPNYLNVPTASGASTPNQAAFISGTSTIELRAELAATVWANATYQTVFILDNGAGADRWSLYINPAGDLEYYFTNSVGTIIFKNPTVALTTRTTNAQSIGVRVVHTVAAGTIDFYTSTDFTTWTQLGTTISGLSTLGVKTTGTPTVVRIGNDFISEIFLGKITKSQVIIGGSTILNMDWTTAAVGSGTWTATTGEVWTALGTATVISAGGTAPSYASSFLGVPASNLWATNYGTNHEVMFTYGTVLDTVEILARVDSTTVPTQGYSGRVTSSGTYEIDTKAGATLTSGSGSVPAAGDSYRLRCLGTLITLDRRPSGGAWTNILSVTDATYTTGTFIGAYLASSAARIDEFGGGSVVNMLTKSAGLIESKTINDTPLLVKSAAMTKTATSTGTGALVKSVGLGRLAVSLVTRATPSTSVLDNFNTGALQLLSARSGWGANAPTTGGTVAQTDAVPTYADSAGGYRGGTWATVFNADQEAYLVYGATASSDMFIYYRITSSAPSAFSGYGVRWRSNGDIEISVVTLGSGAALAQLSASVIPAAGDSLLVRVVGTYHEVWYKPSGGQWSVVLTVTDSTFTAAGQIGYQGFPGQVTDFGGGNVVNQTVVTKSVGLIKAATSTGTGALTKSVGLIKAATSTGTGALTKTVGLIKAVTSTGTASATFSKTFNRTFAATASTTAAFLKSVGLIKSTTSTGTGALVKTVGLVRFALSLVTRANPSTGVLDNFNSGANQLLSARAGWGSASPDTTGGVATTDSAPTYAKSVNSGYGGGTWATAFNADQEVYIVYGSAVCPEIRLYTRMSSSAPSALTGYFVRWFSDGSLSGVLSIADSQFALGSGLAAGTITPSAGDSLMFRSVGSIHEVWYKPSGGQWSLVYRVSESTLTAGGKIGYEGSTVTGQVTDFGGGNVVNQTVVTKSVGLIKAVTSTCTATLTKSVGLIKAATATCTATVTKSVGLVKSVTSTCTAATTKSVGLVKSLTSTVTATFTKTVTRALTFSATATTSATFTKSVGLIKSLTSTCSAVVAKSVGLPRSVTSTCSATFTKSVGLIKSVTSTCSAATSKSVGLIKSLTSTVTATYTGAVTRALTFSKTATVTATFTKSVGLIKSVASTCTAATTKSVGLIKNVTRFPTTGILDDFNTGALQNLTARTGWGAVNFIQGKATFATDAVPTKATKGAAAGSNYWNSQAVDACAYTAFVTWTPASDIFQLATRITAVGANPTYYAVELAKTAATDFQLIRVVAGTRTTIGTLQTQTVAAGDAIGIQAFGSQITSYYKAAAAGSWTLMDTVTDTNITAAGFVAGINNVNPIAIGLDYVGGGDASRATFSQSVGLVRSATSTVSATFTKSVGLIKAVTSTCSAAFTKSVGLIKSVTSTCSAAFAKSAGLTRAVTSTVTPTLTKSVSLFKSVTSTVTAILAKSLVRTFSTNSTITPTVTKQVAPTLSKTSTVTPTDTIQVQPTVATTITTTPSVTKSILKTFSTTITDTATATFDVVAGVVSTALTFATTITVTPTFTKSVGLIESLTGACSSAYTQSVGLLKSKTITDTPSFTKTVGLTESAISTVTATLTKTVGKLIELTGTVLASVTNSMGLTRSTTATATPSFTKSVLITAMKTVTATATFTRTRTIAIMAACVATVTASATFAQHQQYVLTFEATVNVTASMIKEVDLFFADIIEVAVFRGRTLFGLGR